MTRLNAYIELYGHAKASYASDGMYNMQLNP